MFGRINVSRDIIDGTDCALQLSDSGVEFVGLSAKYVMVWTEVTIALPIGDPFEWHCLIRDIAIDVTQVMKKRHSLFISSFDIIFLSPEIFFWLKWTKTLLIFVMKSIFSYEKRTEVSFQWMIVSKRFQYFFDYNILIVKVIENVLFEYYLFTE